MHAAPSQGGQWPEPTSLHDGPRGVVARIIDPATGHPLVVKRLAVSEGEGTRAALALLSVGLVDQVGVASLRGARPVDGAVEVVRDDLPHDASEWMDDAVPWARLLERMHELLDALAAIHASGHVHGSLRPANVRWVEGGPVQLVDGGWPGEERTRADDLRDVGRLLWGALTGELPSDGEPGALVPRQDAPAAVATLLANLLHDDPLFRYDLPADVRTELAALGPAESHEGPLPVAQGPVAPSAAITGPIPWRCPTPPPLPERCPAVAETGWRVHQPPLVGRSGTLDALWTAARDAQEGPVVVLLVGARGMGRTRIARRFARELERGGWAHPVWVDYQGDPLHDGTFGAVRRRLPAGTDVESATEALARHLARQRQVILEDVREEARALRRALGPREEGEPQRTGPVRRELSRSLRDGAWRGRSVVIVDDADRTFEPGEGLELVSGLQRGEGPVLVVATVDLDALDDPAIARRVAGLEAEGARKVVLRPLVGDDLEVFLDGAPERPSPRVHTGIANVAEGCPEVARQLLLALLDLGERTDDGLVWPSGDQPPEAWLHGRIRRVAEHSGAEKRLDDGLALAALAGGALPDALMVPFLGPVAAFAAGSGLWNTHPGREGTWVLSSLVTEAIASVCAERPDRPYLHRRLAEAFGRRPQGRAHLAAARHGLAARDIERAEPRLLHGLSSAWRTGRRDGLDLVAPYLEVTDTPELHLWAVRSTPDDDAAYERAFAAVSEDSEWAARLHVAQGRRHLRRGDVDAADASFARGEKLAASVGLAEVESEAIAGKGAVAHARRNFSGAEVHYTRAVHRMAAADAPRSMAEVMLEQAFLARRMGRFREAAELYDEAADGFREADDLRGVARARLGLARVRRQQLDIEAARSWIRVVNRLAADLLAPDLQRDVWLVEGDVERQAGEVEHAASCYLRYLASEGRRDPEGVVFAELGLAQIALDGGDAHGAYERANAAAKALEDLPHHWLWAPYRLVVSALLADRDDHMQTWQWLWSASELGLGDTVDRDTVALLTRVCNIAKLAGWGNVIRVSAKLAVEQLERLGDREAANRVQQDITGIILK